MLKCEMKEFLNYDLLSMPFRSLSLNTIHLIFVLFLVFP